jgi:phosphate transport system substrate-binding protein
MRAGQGCNDARLVRVLVDEAISAANDLERWGVEFNKVQPGIQVNYQSVGSGAGVKNFIQGVVDFGASDAAMSDEEMAKVAEGVVLIPATAGEIVYAYNLPGVTGLKLSREVMVGIYLGTVKKWNDPAIVKDNPDLKLPNTPIQVAYRSDGSGTTYVFTQHLSKISAKFDDEVGTDKSVTFPVGVGGKGNEGVTALIKQSPGTVGYVEYGYAKDNGLSMASLQNKSGNFVAPDIASASSTGYTITNNISSIILNRIFYVDGLSVYITSIYYVFGYRHTLPVKLDPNQSFLSEIFYKRFR